MQYPSLAEVESADKQQLLDWYRMLPIAESQQNINTMHRIIERLDYKCGGNYVPDLIEASRKTALQPSSDTRTLIVAELASERDLAIGLKVRLDTTKHTEQFPFKNPSMYMWFPKQAIAHIQRDIWEVDIAILEKNKVSAFNYFVDYVLSKYGVVINESRAYLLSP